MTLADDRQKIDRTDVAIALGVGIAALVCYVRTLAPDMLYGDSGEFQALSYVMGISHTTGYPVYMLLGKIFGSLIPFGSFAYRINLLSAIYAAGTLSGVYLLGRFVTRSRVGPVLGSILLGVTYSFWSQAVIAEVYTLATLAIAWSVFCLWRWQEDPAQRGGWVLAALLLLGLGVHTVVELIVPAVGIFMLWTLWVRRHPGRVWGRSIGMAVLGGAIGAAIFFGLFFLSDTLINPPASFLNVSLIPSRSLWGASAADLDSFVKRVYNTVVSLQWGKELFSGDPAYMVKELDKYGGALINRDFTWPILALGLLGLIVSTIRRTRLTGFMLLATLTLLFYIVNYKVSSKYAFFLATYIFIVVLTGAGIGFLLEKIRAFFFDHVTSTLTRRLKPQQDLPGRPSEAVRGNIQPAQSGFIALDAVSTAEKTNVTSPNISDFQKRRGLQVVYLVALFLAAAALIAPVAESRWTALVDGKATFVKDDDYTYPLKDLTEPRTVAEATLRSVPDNALLLMDWRALYATVYLANAEQKRPNISFREASPFPSKDAIPDSLLQEVREALNAGRPVYIERMLDNVRSNFNTRPVAASRLIQLLPKP